MKKKWIIIMSSLLIIGSIFTGCGSKASGGGDKKADSSLEEIKKKGKFVVGLDDSFPPMGFRDDKGEIVGFDIDLAKETAKRMGVEVEFKPVVWKNVTFSINNKDIDVIWNGLTITEDRKKKINFTESYLKNRQIIIVKEASKIKSKKDFKGKVVGIQMGSSSNEAFDKDIEVKNSVKELKKYPTNPEALMDLQAGRIDAVVIDEVVGRYYISKKPGIYKVLDDNFGKEEYGIGYRIGEKSFGEELNKVLRELKKDGTANKISKKWFNEVIINKK